MSPQRARKILRELNRRDRRELMRGETCWQEASGGIYAIRKDGLPKFLPMPSLEFELRRLL